MTTLTRRTIIFCAEYAVVVPGVILFLSALRQKTLEEGLLILLVGSILLGATLILKEILKRVIKKHRPHGATTFFRPGDYYAFPSGHAAGLATVTMFMFYHDAALATLSLIVSFIIIIARVRARVHDMYDMAGGIALGVLVVTFGRSGVESLMRSVLGHFL